MKSLKGVQKLLILGSSCFYPLMATWPMREDALLTGVLEPNSESCTIAKIARIELCESYSCQQYCLTHGVDYRSVMLASRYGPGEKYHLENYHVIPSLIRRLPAVKVALAPSVAIWRKGTLLREFLYVDDMATASLDK